MQTETPGKPLRLPRSTWFIVTTEACERFSFYGMVSILTLYLQNLFLQHQPEVTAVVRTQAEAFAKERVHLFNAGVYYLPILGGFLADKYFGRYRTILFLSLFYCLGHGALALFEGKEAGIYLGLALIAIGAGGIKPCVSAFVADQFDNLDERGLAKVYGIFYWAINVGAALSMAIIPLVAPVWENGVIVQENWGYSWAFGIPGIFMAIAAFVFWLGTPLYVNRRPPAQSVAAVDPAERAADWKTIFRIALVLSPLIIFWALYYQLSTSWVQQGDAMQPTPILGYTVDGQRMQAASGLLILVLVPFMITVGYPAMRKVGISTSPTSKMTIGMLVTGAAFVISGLLQNRIDASTDRISVMWQLLPYFPLEIGEVMVSVTGLEFAYANAPPRMKSMVMGVWFGITGTGNLSVAILTHYIGTTVVSADGTVTIPDDHKPFHLTSAEQFYFYAGMMFVGAIAFMILAKLLMPNRSPDDLVVPATELGNE
jgi:proton-dependent oligopeptide transporter, POT family